MDENKNCKENVESTSSEHEIEDESTSDMRSDLDGIIAKISKPGSDDYIDDAEAQKIWTDLDILIKNINNFTAGQKLTRGGICNLELTNDDNTEEKEDGPPEKMLCVPESQIDTAADIYQPMEAAVQEIDWSVTGPVMTGCVNDLQQLQLLNAATSDMVARLKKLILHKSARCSGLNKEIQAALDE